MAVQRVFPDAELVWYSEIEKHPSTLLSARFPGVPNIGDLTRVDWNQGLYQVPGEPDPDGLERVDILTCGYGDGNRSPETHQTRQNPTGTEIHV